MGGAVGKAITKETALPGRAAPAFKVASTHAANGNTVVEPFPSDTKTVIFGMGCFWGAERVFWKTEGVFSTQVGFAGGFTTHPTYRETCGGGTGHAEVVRVVYKPAIISFTNLMRVFWEKHNPTTYNRQGNDSGSEYRSIVLCKDDADLKEAERTKELYQAALNAKGGGEIVTEIKVDNVFYYAEDDHQQYLHKIPHGYCSMKGTGVSCPL